MCNKYTTNTLIDVCDISLPQGMGEWIQNLLAFLGIFTLDLQLLMVEWGRVMGLTDSDTRAFVIAFKPFYRVPTWLYFSSQWNIQNSKANNTAINTLQQASIVYVSELFYWFINDGYHCQLHLCIASFCHQTFMDLGQMRLHLKTNKFEIHSTLPHWKQVSRQSINLFLRSLWLIAKILKSLHQWFRRLCSVSVFLFMEPKQH